MISFLYLSVIYADIIYVDVKSNEPKIEQKCGKSISTRCKTISGALRRAKDGDTIFIFPGIYFGSKNNNLCSPTSITNTSSIDSLNFTSFNVTCPKNLTFFGNNSHPGDVVINGNYSTNIRGVYALDATYNFSQITFSDFYINESIPTISSLNGIDVGVGAAIFGVGSKITLNNVIFKNNQAKQGGALAALLGSTVIVHQSSFTGNQATDSGGAIVIESSILHMHSSSLWLNSVRKVPHSTTTSFYGGGGALLLMNPLDVLADNCQFYNNSSPRSGGALHMMTSSAPTVSFIIGNSSFNHNKVIVEADCQGSVVACVADGGALYIDSDFAGVIDGCTFEGNSVNSKLAIPVSFEH